MEYFGISKTEGKGCPIGLLDVMLLDKYYGQNITSKLNYGLFPWYANPSQGLPHSKFPPEMVLISNEPDLLNFDLRSCSKFFHLMSRGMLEVALALNCAMEDYSPAKVLRPDGSPGSAREYFAVKFAPIGIGIALDMEQSILFPLSKSTKRHIIKKYVFNGNFHCALFQLDNMNYGHDTIYCSIEFLTKFKSNKYYGIDFTPVEGMTSGKFSEV